MHALVVVGRSGVCRLCSLSLVKLFSLLLLSFFQFSFRFGIYSILRIYARDHDDIYKTSTRGSIYIHIHTYKYTCTRLRTCMMLAQYLF